MFALYTRVSSGLPLSVAVSSHPQGAHILSGTNSKKSVLRWPHKLVIGQQNYSFWPGPVWPNCSTTHSPVADLFGHKIDTVRNISKYVFQVDCSTGCLYNVQEDPREQADLATSLAYTPLVASLQQELHTLNLNSCQVQSGLPSTHVSSIHSLTLMHSTSSLYARAKGPGRSRSGPQELVELRKALQANPSLPSEVAERLREDVWQTSAHCLQ